MLLDIREMSFLYPTSDAPILRDVNLTVSEGDRIGLVGMNGAGKTTLLRIIERELEPTEGEVVRKRDLTVGYLRQNFGLESNRTVYEETVSVFDDVKDAKERLARISSEMANVDHDSHEYAVLSARYDAVTSYIHSRDGYNCDVRVRTVLNGMGFEGTYDQIVSTMSGGEKTRLALAKLLLTDPEVLILDEPTNHLDFRTLGWLEGYLGGFKGAIITVSHDRYFLDRTVTKIWDLEDARIEEYKGNYTKYKTTKREVTAFRLKEYVKQSEMIASMKEYAERNIVRATTSKSAKSRLHRLENIEVLEKPRTYTKPPKFHFEFDEESAKVPLTVNRFTLSVGERVLARDVSFEIMKGQRVAVIGMNGTGKSTLLRALREDKSPAIKWGRYVRIGYYDQENANLTPTNTVLEELWWRMKGESQTKVRAILGSLLLGEEDVVKPVSTLSGGEKAKLGFAIVTAERGNVLILDEPTNHLDLMTREALEEALKSYEGTVIFVSHDRYFINAVAGRVLEIEDGAVTPYDGGFDSYERIKREAREAAAIEKARAQASVKSTVKEGGYRSAEDRAREVKRKQRIRELESLITALETEEQEIFASMSGETDYQVIARLSKRAEEIRAESESAYLEWTELMEE